MLLSLLGRQIEVVRLSPGSDPVGQASHRPERPPIVFLHEALGSVSHWRDFPQRVADATACEAIAYSRLGHGRSSRRTDSFTTSYLHDEALVWLPALLDALGLDAPYLFGHSDGASIALIAAAAGRRLPGLVALAPHVVVEEAALEGIERARVAYRETDLPERLARHHDDPEGVFRRWHEAWLSPAHRAWNIEDSLPRIACPVLVIQGEEDEYATTQQVGRIARLAPRVESLKLAACGHSPHRDRAETVIAATTSFIRRCDEARG
jgi:pimeloyl-ACP methyl ester carboxylesterase